MTQSDKELYLTKSVTVNYVSNGRESLETIINCVVFFRYERQTKILRVYIKEVSLKAKERLFKEIPHMDLSSGSQLKQYAEEWYKENLEELRAFA